MIFVASTDNRYGIANDSRIDRPFAHSNHSSIFSRQSQNTVKLTINVHAGDMHTGDWCY